VNNFDRDVQLWWRRFSGTSLKNKVHLYPEIG